MTRLTRNVVSAAMASAWAVAMGLVASSALADLVTLTPDATTKGAAGGVVRGTVVSESPTKVEVKLGNTVTPIPTNEVASIDYDGHPVSLQQAQDKDAQNNLAEAAELYKKAMGEASGKPFILEDAAFGQARAVADLAQSEPARVAEAIKLLDDFSKTYKSGRHVAPALEALARLQIARDNTPAAEAAIAALTKLPGGDDRSASLRVRLLTRKGQATEAIAEIDKAISNSPEGSARRRDAQLAKASTLATLKKYDEAESLVRSVIKAAPAEDASAQAVAHNTLGDCLLAAGRNREALAAYLHTDLLFSKSKDEHARALSQIARLWREMKRPDRADEAADRLKQEYPRSPYAQANNP